MARRTKREMELMNDDARYYLIQTNNNPQAAHELMIKEHLESGQPIPYYIKGVKDFTKISQELAVELNRKEQMNKLNQERYEAKETIVNFILNLTQEEMKTIYKEYKDNVQHHEKLNLVEVYTFISTNELTEKYINQSIINTFTKIYRDQLESVQNNEVAVAESNELDEKEVVVTTKEEINTASMDDNFTCTCGNTVDFEGFAACNKAGKHVGIGSTWEGHYKCDRCNQVYLDQTG